MKIKNIAEHAFLGYIPETKKPKATPSRGKLKPEDIAGILSALRSGKTQKQVALAYGVHQSVICRIRSNQRWKKSSDNE